MKRSDSIRSRTLIAVGVMTVGLGAAVMSGHAMFVLGMRSMWLNVAFFIGVLAVLLILVRELARAAAVSIARGWRQDHERRQG